MSDKQNTAPNTSNLDPNVASYDYQNYVQTSQHPGTTDTQNTSQNLLATAYSTGVTTNQFQNAWSDPSQMAQFYSYYNQANLLQNATQNYGTASEVKTETTNLDVTDNADLANNAETVQSAATAALSGTLGNDSATDLASSTAAATLLQQTNSAALMSAALSGGYGGGFGSLGGLNYGWMGNKISAEQPPAGK